SAYRRAGCARPPARSTSARSLQPKLGRRMTFYRRAVVEQWVLLEADPSVIAFWERPGYIQIDRNKRLADFVVHYVDRNELVILDDRSVEVDATKPDRVLNAHTY